VQPCPTAAEVAQVSGILQASGLLIQEALDIMQSGIVLSLLSDALLVRCKAPTCSAGSAHPVCKRMTFKAVFLFHDTLQHQ
jgi:hypothetical protein